MEKINQMQQSVKMEEKLLDRIELTRAYIGVFYLAGVVHTNSLFWGLI